MVATKVACTAMAGVLHLVDERRGSRPADPGSGDCATRRAAARVRRSGALPDGIVSASASASPEPVPAAWPGASGAVARRRGGGCRRRHGHDGRNGVDGGIGLRSDGCRFGARGSAPLARRCAACAASLRRSSLTRARNLIGVMRASSACTRSSSGGCVANQRGAELVGPGRIAAGEEHVRDIDGALVLAAACPRRSPPSR